MKCKQIHMSGMVAFCSVKKTINFVETKHTHPFNGPLFGTTQVSRYQKGKLDSPEASDSKSVKKR